MAAKWPPRGISVHRTRLCRADIHRSGLRGLNLKVRELVLRRGLAFPHARQLGGGTRSFGLATPAGAPAVQKFRWRPATVDAVSPGGPGDEAGLVAPLVAMG
jgi:hypothetical protein